MDFDPDSVHRQVRGALRGGICKWEEDKKS